MIPGKRVHSIVAMLNLVTLCMLGCGGDGGEAEIRPASVEGIWEGVSNNPEEATLRDCTGDLEILTGRTIEQVVDDGAECTVSSPSTVDQRGSSFAFLPSDFQCTDGNYGHIEGGGTVTADRLTLHRDFVSDRYGYTESHYYSGTVNSTSTIELLESRISVSGGAQGECSIEPALSITITIIRDLKRFDPSGQGISSFSSVAY